MKKSVTSIILTLVMCLTFIVPAFAADNDGTKRVKESEVQVVQDPNASTLNDADNQTEEITPNDVADIYDYRKTNVTTDYEWTTYFRVSDNMVGKAGGGSITCTVSKTVGASISGSVYGISVSASGSCTSSTSYTMNLAPYEKAYMGYRVYCYVERGTRERYNTVTGAVVSTNTYTATSPQYGEYVLIDY